MAVKNLGEKVRCGRGGGDHKEESEALAASNNGLLIAIIYDDTFLFLLYWCQRLCLPSLLASFPYYCYRAMRRFVFRLSLGILSVFFLYIMNAHYLYIPPTPATAATTKLPPNGRFGFFALFFRLSIVSIFQLNSNLSRTPVSWQYFLIHFSFSFLFFTDQTYFFFIFFLFLNGFSWKLPPDSWCANLRKGSNKMSITFYCPFDLFHPLLCLSFTLFSL